jgi:hypothetical protein
VSWVSAGSWNSLPGSSCPPTQRPPQQCSLQFTRVQWVRYGMIIIALFLFYSKSYLFFSWDNLTEFLLVWILDRYLATCRPQLWCLAP